MNYGTECVPCTIKPEKLFNWISEQRRLILVPILAWIHEVDRFHRTAPHLCATVIQINKHFVIFGRLSRLNFVQTFLNIFDKYTFTLRTIRCSSMKTHLQTDDDDDDEDCKYFSEMCVCVCALFKCYLRKMKTFLAVKLFAYDFPLFFFGSRQLQSSLKRSLSASSRCKTSLNIMKIHTLLLLE